MDRDEHLRGARIDVPGMTVTGVQFIHAPHRIQLWDTSDAKIYYGWVPASTPTDTIKLAVHFYRNGYECAAVRTRESIQQRLLDALSVPSHAESR